MALLVEISFPAETAEGEARSQAVDSWIAAAHRLGRQPTADPDIALVDDPDRPGELVLRVTGHATFGTPSPAHTEEVGDAEHP